SKVKSGISLAGAVALKPKRRLFKGNKNNDDADADDDEKEAAPGTNKSNKSKEHKDDGDDLDEEEGAPTAHQSFGADESTKVENPSDKEQRKSPKKRKKGKKMKDKAVTEKPVDDGEETTEATEDGGPAPTASTSFGIDDSSNHSKTSKNPLRMGDVEVTESVEAPAKQEFGIDEASAQVSENPSTAVATEASRKSSKSKKKGKKLKPNNGQQKQLDEDTKAKRKASASTKENDDSQEEVSFICKALGMDTFKFFCLRHPDQVITSLNPIYETVQKCPLCESEFQADPQRMERLSKSMEDVAGKVQSLQNDTEAWKERTQVTNLPSSALNETLASVSDEGKEKNMSEKEWLDQVMERSFQVQAWKTLGKPPLRKDPDYARYFRLYRVGVPLIAVKFTAERDGFDPSVLDLSPDLPLESQCPMSSKDSSTADRDEASDLDDENHPEGHFNIIPENIEKVQIAFNRLRAKDLRLRASTVGKNSGHRRRTRSTSRDAKKKRDARHSRSGSRDGKQKRDPEGDKAGKRRMAKGKSKMVDADEKDRVILKLKDELAKKEFVIESLHEKVHEMEQHLHNHSSSHHKSFGSMSFDDMSNPGVPPSEGVGAESLLPLSDGFENAGDTIGVLSDEPTKVALDDASFVDGSRAISERFENEYSSIRGFDASFPMLSESAVDAAEGASDSSNDGYDSAGPAFVGDILHDSMNEPVAMQASFTSLTKNGNAEQQDTSDSSDDEYNTDPSDADIKGLESAKIATAASVESSASDKKDAAWNGERITGSEDVSNSSDSFEDEYTPSTSNEDTAHPEAASEAEILPALTAVSSGEAENSFAASSDDDDDLALAAALHESEGPSTDASVSDSSDSRSGASGDAEKDNENDTDDLASDEEIDAALALAASLHDTEDSTRVQDDNSDSFDDEYDSDALGSDLKETNTEDASPPDGFVAVPTDSSDDDNDALELAASVHASEATVKEQSKMDDSFVNEFAAEDSSDDEKEESFLNEFNPTLSSDAEATNGTLDAPGVDVVDGINDYDDSNSDDDDDDDDDALNLAASVHADRGTEGQEKDPPEPSSSADYTSGSSDAEDEGSACPEAISHRSPGSDEYEDEDDVALDLAASLHAASLHGNEDNPVLESPNPGVFLDSPKPHTRRDEEQEPRHYANIALLNDQNSDNEDDELMMAAALLVREDDGDHDDTSTSYDGGAHLAGFDDELIALESAQQQAGLFYDSGAMGPGAVDAVATEPHHCHDDDVSSDSSYEAVSSSEDGLDLENALDDDDDDYDFNNDHASSSSYKSYANDDGEEDSGGEMV
ncbi:MAG: hypothetical protein SGILL_004389, partial [Bacillariaceae sp.]